jgi:hypothetical protein
MDRHDDFLVGSIANRQECSREREKTSFRSKLFLLNQLPITRRAEHDWRERKLE